MAEENELQQPAPELAADAQDAPPPSPPSHRLRNLAIVLGVAVAGGVGWFLFGTGETDGGGDVPVVRADGTPIKERPEDPGGMDVPDQDKLVYDRLDGDSPRPQVERLLPPPETPMEPPVVDELAATDAPPAPPSLVPEPISPQGADTDEAAIAAAEPADGDQPDAPENLPTPEAATPAPPPPPAPEAPPQPAVTAATDAAGGYRVQLASVRSMEAAQQEWTRLTGRHGDLLGDLDLDVERADLGERGVFYRVRGGPLAGEEAAESLCETMKARDVGCLVVAP